MVQSVYDGLLHCVPPVIGELELVTSETDPAWLQDDPDMSEAALSSEGSDLFSDEDLSSSEDDWAYLTQSLAPWEEDGGD